MQRSIERQTTYNSILKQYSAYALFLYNTDFKKLCAVMMKECVCVCVCSKSRSPCFVFPLVAYVLSPFIPYKKWLGGLRACL